MIKRLRIKFVCINMTIVTAMLLVIFGMVLQFTQENLENQSIRMMQNVAENERVQPGRPGESREEVQLPFFFVTIDFRGEMTAASGGYYDLSDEEQVLQIIQQARNTDAETGILKEYKMRFQKRTMPFGEAMVFVDISSEIATMENLVKTCVFIGIISFSVFLGLSFWLARWAVKPVETAWNQQRQFVADASHELKTPLTVIMTNAELLQSPEYTDADRRRFSDSILTMSHQMRGLVESLLQLARADSGQTKAEVAELDYSKLVEDALLPFEPVYFEQGLMLESRIEPGIRLVGAESHLRQVVEILLDNGQKYSSPGGTVWVELSRQGRGQCMLRVSSPGAAMSAKECRDIFKRFYRADRARSMNHSYGLGLAIAQRIVTDHRGKIWAESKEEINTFFVTLPLA